MENKGKIRNFYGAVAIEIMADTNWRTIDYADR